jgi:3-oxoacyl-[acyl-carrier protein] reductase/meso-butanediol dehydrogenase/(S,S)-butanediol dehydrogenase/diacetyl reductase
MHDNLSKKDSAPQKSAVITGGNRGIGLDITEAFVNAGYFVVVGARQERGLKDRFGDSIVFQEIDVRNESDHKKLVELAVKQTGGLDVYVNNAGFSAWRPIEQIDGVFLNEMLNTNLKGAFWGCKAAASVLKLGGSIINISSIAGKRGSANNAAYVASKFGMNGLTQSLAKELGPRGIRVNALCPVLIDTDGLLEAMREPYAPGNSDPVAFIEKFAVDNAALKRLPTGAEVASMCIVLASGAASAITGQCTNVDCGVFPQ